MRISDWSSDVCSSDLAALAPWLPTFLDDQIKLNDFGASDHIIAALAEHGWTAPLLLARGDLYRAHGNPRDLVVAAEFYGKAVERSEEHTSELQTLMRISYAVFCLKKKKKSNIQYDDHV